MKKTLIGIVTFGNLPFTQLTVNEIRRTVKSPVDILVIVGKPGDTETYQWISDEHVRAMPRGDSVGQFTVWPHETNKGFPASLNDILDAAWNKDWYANLIICANDVVPYPGAIDALIETAATTDYEWICATKFDARALVAMYPEEAKKYFEGDGCLFTDFAARPWDLHAAHVAATAPAIEPDGFKDVAELTLYKRSVFEQFGYFDANYWPNGYYFDNDAARRAVNLRLRGCGVTHAVYFHFWSRTVYQGDERPHGKYFDRNGGFYRWKWGGDWEHESWKVPFNGAVAVSQRTLCGSLSLPASLKIPDRANEAAIIEYWSKL